MRKQQLVAIFSAYNLALLTLISLAPVPAAADMQIPNPLMQPKKAAAPGSATAGTQGTGELPMPPASQRDQVMAPGNSYGMGGNRQNGAGAPDGVADAFREARDRFAGFYVSAIVGKRATLRRATAVTAGAGSPQRVPNSPAGFPPAFPSQGTASVLGSGSAGAAVQSETLTIEDGEAIDFIGDGVTLTPKITSSSVSIYFAEDSVAGSHKVGRRQVVFMGQVESTRALAPAAIVLEKRDQTYTQSISVATGARGQDSGAPQNNGLNAPATAPSNPVSGNQ